MLKTSEIVQHQPVNPSRTQNTPIHQALVQLRIRSWRKPSREKKKAFLHELIRAPLRRHPLLWATKPGKAFVRRLSSDAACSGGLDCFCLCTLFPKGAILEDICVITTIDNLSKSSKQSNFNQCGIQAIAASHCRAAGCLYERTVKIKCSAPRFL